MVQYNQKRFSPEFRPIRRDIKQHLTRSNFVETTADKWNSTEKFYLNTGFEENASAEEMTGANISH